MEVGEVVNLVAPVLLALLALGLTEAVEDEGVMDIFVDPVLEEEAQEDIVVVVQVEESEQTV